MSIPRFGKKKEWKRKKRREINKWEKLLATNFERSLNQNNLFNIIII